MSLCNGGVQLGVEGCVLGLQSCVVSLLVSAHIVVIVLVMPVRALSPLQAELAGAWMVHTWRYGPFSHYYSLYLYMYLRCDGSLGLVGGRVALLPSLLLLLHLLAISYLMVLVFHHRSMAQSSVRN